MRASAVSLATVVVIPMLASPGTLVTDLLATSGRRGSILVCFRWWRQRRLLVNRRLAKDFAEQVVNIVVLLWRLLLLRRLLFLRRSPLISR